MNHLYHFAFRTLAGAAIALTVAALLVSLVPTSALAVVNPPIRLKCEDASCGLCKQDNQGNCNNTDGEKNGFCGSAGTNCAGCGCDYVSTKAPCACSK